MTKQFPTNERFTMFTPEDADEFFSDPANDYAAESEQLEAVELSGVMADISDVIETFFTSVDDMFNDWRN